MTTSAPMRRAIELALESVAAGGGPFGAVVVREGRIVGEGANRVVLDKDPTAHAEVLAIRAACARLGTHTLEGCEIHTSCEPCPMCLGAISWARLDRIHYASSRHDAEEAGFDDAAFHAQLVLPPEERRVPAVQEGREEALAAFRAWLGHPDRRAY